MLSEASLVVIGMGAGTLVLGPIVTTLVERVSNGRARAKWRWADEPLVDKYRYVVARLEKSGTRRSELRNAVVVERVGFWGRILQWAFGPRRNGERVWYRSGLWVLEADDEQKPYLRHGGRPVHDLNLAMEDGAAVVLDGVLSARAYLPGRVRFWRWRMRQPLARRLRVLVSTSHGTLRRRLDVTAHRQGAVVSASPPK